MNNTRRYLVLATVAVALWPATIVLAQDCETPPTICDTCWTGPFDGVWTATDLYWTFGEPDNTMVACIFGTNYCVVSSGACIGGDRDGLDCADDADCPGTGAFCGLMPDATAKAVIVGASARLYLTAPPITLTLGNATNPVDSQVDGQFHIWFGNTVKIAADHTITGVGGEITGPEHPVHGAFGRIDGDASRPTLTIKPDPVSGDNSDPSTSLRLHRALVVDVALVNDAYVIADHDFSGFPLTLQGEAKSGNGFWMAESPAELIVETTITGSGTWKIDTGTTIRVDAPLLDLSGNVELSAGTLELNRNFTTTGDLLLTGGGVILASGKTANFD